MLNPVKLAYLIVDSMKFQTIVLESVIAFLDFTEEPMENALQNVQISIKNGMEMPVFANLVMVYQTVHANPALRTPNRTMIERVANA